MCKSQRHIIALLHKHSGTQLQQCSYITSSEFVSNAAIKWPVKKTYCSLSWLMGRSTGNSSFNHQSYGFLVNLSINLWDIQLSVVFTCPPPLQTSALAVSHPVPLLQPPLVPRCCVEKSLGPDWRLHRGITTASVATILAKKRISKRN